jgi:hypothetical protein
VTERIEDLIEASSLGTPDAAAMRALTSDGRARQIVARAHGLPCCDSHNIHCEPPPELCCGGCTEAAHNSFPIPHADGSRCVLPVREDMLDFPTGWRLAREGVTHTDPRCSYVQHDGGFLCDCGAIETEWQRRVAEQQAERTDPNAPKEKL